MLLLKNKNRVYFYIIAFLFLSTITNNIFLKSFNKIFLINKINIDIDKYELNKIISSETSFLKTQNIFFINQQQLINKLSNFNFLENISIKKSYPSTIIIRANQTNIIAITYFNQKKFYVGSNGKFISTEFIPEYKKLPIIFGQFKIPDFISLQKNLKILNMDNNKITKYYFHKNKRWDLYFENNKIIMLPRQNTENAIKIYNQFISIHKIMPNSIIDLRIPNRIVIKNE
tara:strand:- start:12216 stop:12905 length:690 start_codon:yes stop_codon:yes gene_type:complete